MWKFPSQGMNLSCNHDLCHSCSNPRSLTHWARPVIEPLLPQRQRWILNPLHHSRSSGCLFLRAENKIILFYEINCMKVFLCLNKSKTIACFLFCLYNLMLLLMPFQLQIWDTAGQERFRSITQSYYRSANALILTYDITCEESFRCLPEWLREIEQYASNKVITVLVGK